MVMKKIEAGTWKPEKEGDKIHGTFISKEHDVGKFDSIVYNLDVNGEPMSVWGSAALNPDMIGIKPGDEIEIVYKGTTPSKKGADTKLYDVFIDDGTTEQETPEQEVPEAPEQEAPEEEVPIVKPGVNTSE